MRVVKVLIGRVLLLGLIAFAHRSFAFSETRPRPAALELESRPVAFDSLSELDGELSRSLTCLCLHLMRRE